MHVNVLSKRRLTPIAIIVILALVASWFVAATTAPRADASAPRSAISVTSISDGAVMSLTDSVALATQRKAMFGAVGTPPTASISVPRGMTYGAVMTEVSTAWEIPMEFWCTAGIFWIGVGIITAAAAWPEGILLAVFWVETLFSAFATGYTCGQTLHAREHSWHNFCTGPQAHPERHFLGSIWDYNLGQERFYYRYECGGYTGWGYAGGPTSAWPSKEAVSRQLEEDNL